MAVFGEADERFKEIDAVLHVMKGLKCIKRPFRLSDLHLLLDKDSEVKRFLQSKWKLYDLGAFVIKYSQHFIVQPDETVLLRNRDFTMEQLHYITRFFEIMSTNMSYDFLSATCFICFADSTEDRFCSGFNAEIFNFAHDFLHIHNHISPPKLVGNEQDADSTELKVHSLSGFDLSAKQMEYTLFIERRAVNFFHQLLVYRRSISVRRAHIFVHTEPEISDYLQKYYTFKNLESFFKRYPEKFYLENEDVRAVISKKVSSPPMSDLTKKEYTSQMEKRAVDFYDDLLDERHEVSVKQAHSFLKGDADLRAYLKKEYTIGNLTAFFEKYPERFLLLNGNVYPLVRKGASASRRSKKLAQGSASNVDANVSYPRSAKESLKNHKVTSDSLKEKDSKADDNVSSPSWSSLFDTKRPKESQPKNEATSASSEETKDNENTSLPGWLTLVAKRYAKTSLVKKRITPDSPDVDKCKNDVSIPSPHSSSNANQRKGSLMKNQVTPESAEDEEDNELDNKPSQLTFFNSSQVKESLMKIKLACDRFEEENEKKNVSLLSWLPFFNRNRAKESLTKNKSTPERCEKEKGKKNSSLLSWFSWFNGNRVKDSLIKNEVTQISDEGKDNVSVLGRHSLLQAPMTNNGISDCFELEEDTKFDNEDVSIASQVSLLNTSQAKQSVMKTKVSDNSELEKDNELDKNDVSVQSQASSFEEPWKVVSRKKVRSDIKKDRVG